MASRNNILVHGKNCLGEWDLFKFRALYFQPPKNLQKVRRDFSGQLARQRFGITLSFYRFAHGEALRITLRVTFERPRYPGF